MTRRDFVRVALAGLAGAALLALGFAPQARVVVRHRIRGRLGDWTIADADLDRFLDAFEAQYGDPAPARDDFLQILVLSTDAFAPGRATKALTFVQLYHPYKAPCYNPLARR